MRDGPGDRLLTGSFVLVTAAALSYFVGLGILAPVLPRYIESELGGDGLAVGVGVGAFAVSAALLRPAVGRIGDRRGRRLLVLAGGSIAAVSILGYELATNLPILTVMRLVTGAGEAAMFVGAATAVQDMAPPARRGEAASYFSVAVYGGLGLGPVVGEAIRVHVGYRSVWLAAALTCVVAVLVALRMDPATGTVPPAAAPGSGRGRLLHRAALRPGVILALSATGWAGFSAFVPLYVDELGIDSAGPVFAIYAAMVLAVRIVGAKLPDRLGPILGSSLALAFQAAGFALLTAWSSTAGLYAGTIVYSMGTSLLYPALFPLVVDTAPEEERSHAIATFTLFFDVSQGLGAFALGGVVALAGSERWAFAVAGLADLVGLALLRSAAAERRAPAPAVA